MKYKYFIIACMGAYLGIITTRFHVGWADGFWFGIAFNVVPIAFAVGYGAME